MRGHRVPPFEWPTPCRARRLSFPTTHPWPFLSHTPLVVRQSSSFRKEFANFPRKRTWSRVNQHQKNCFSELGNGEPVAKNSLPEHIHPPPAPEKSSLEHGKRNRRPLSWSTPRSAGP